MKRFYAFSLASVFYLCAVCLFPATAEVRLPNVFSTHMVLQRDMPITIWGWAEPNEKLSVTLASTTLEVRANERGEWKVALPAMKAGGPFVLKVVGSSSVQFDDVMVGEVWLCSGQSNMDMGIGLARDAQKEIAEANDPNLRLLMLKRKTSPMALSNIDDQWERCSSQTVAKGGWGGFSAAAYYFGRELRRKLRVPVGLIQASLGGTSIEYWTPPEGYAAVPALSNVYRQVLLADPTTTEYKSMWKETIHSTEQWLADARQSLESHNAVPPMPRFPQTLLDEPDVQAPTLYYGMIHPLIPYSLRGAIWYQGESNAIMGQGILYADRMEALIKGWRLLWGEGDFPFYFVQIAPYNYHITSGYFFHPEMEAQVWDAQDTVTRTVDNCGEVVVNDIANLQDIHPKNKQEVGRRLAVLALAKTYGEQKLIYSGPTFKSFTVQGDKLRVNFDHADRGLASRDGKPLNCFEIIDANQGNFVRADAQIQGSSVLLTTPSVKNPVAVNFAWTMLAEPNLVNGAGLPAEAFHAGDLPHRDMLPKISEANKYQLLYDLDLGKLSKEIHYDVDNHQNITLPFDRIAYFLELQHRDGSTDYIYTSMNAFTRDLEKIGVPTAVSGAHFQQNVTNLDVFSNVKGIEEGTALPGGNIEFWPNTYGPGNSNHVPDAMNGTYDFGDQPVNPIDGYGSMQVHNHYARQTLFAINHWSAGTRADIGIGNQATGNSDWTFAANAHFYETKRLRIFVRLAP